MAINRWQNLEICNKQAGARHESIIIEVCKDCALIKPYLEEGSALL
jgi:hypothetical protein